ncbi:MAG TPA: lipid A deacylase LpxR family protein [Pseudomonadales bacterium]|nr:lipid A deacylase LpxR family protein [Pseudomonadales bacterium]
MDHRTRKTLALGLLAFLSLAPLALHAAEDEEESPGGYLTVYLDNDLFSGTDRNYTNGVRVSWISEGEPLFDLFPARRPLEQLVGADADYKLIRAISGFEQSSLDDGTLELNYGLSLTQLMFTPEDFAATTQPAGERRYAGWLGLGFSVHARDRSALNSAEVIFGTTGPNSQAREAQNLIHDLRNFDKFQGWDDQIPNEVTLDLSFTQKRRVRFLERNVSGFSIDGFTEWGARLGTFRTAAFGGGFFRAGFNLPADFSDPRIRSTAYSHRIFSKQKAAENRWSVYGLFGVTATGVAFDASLDGPMFSDFDTGNRREPWIGEAFVGFGARWQTLELSYVQTFRTKEYDEQRGGTSFGSLAVRWQI